MAELGQDSQNRQKENSAVGSLACLGLHDHVAVKPPASPSSRAERACT